MKKTQRQRIFMTCIVLAVLMIMIIMIDKKWRSAMDAEASAAVESAAAENEEEHDGTNDRE